MISRSFSCSSVDVFHAPQPRQPYHLHYRRSNSIQGIVSPEIAEEHAGLPKKRQDVLLQTTYTRKHRRGDRLVFMELEDRGKKGGDAQPTDIKGGVEEEDKKVKKRKKKEDSFFKEFAFWWKKYPLKYFKSAMRVLMLVFWVWLLLSFSGIFESKDDAKLYQKRHGVIGVATRLPDFEYYTMAVHPEELTVVMKVNGPFLPELQDVREYNEELKKTVEVKKYVFEIVLERWLVKPPSTKPPDRKSQNSKNSTIVAIEGGASFGTSIVKVMMTNATGRNHRKPLDYNNYPRNVRLVILKSDYIKANVTKKELANYKSFYVLGFGVDRQQNESIPFSFSFSLDPITMKTRVLIALLPLFVMAAFCVLEVNRGIAALFGVTTTAACFLKTGLAPTIFTIATWVYWDHVFYCISMLLLMTLLAETNIHAAVAYIYLKITRYTFLPSIILINVVPALLSMFFNNIFVAMAMLPLTMRLMELLGKNPAPAIINMLMICNIFGKAGIGTLFTKKILKHKAAVNTQRVQDVITVKKLYDLMAPCTVVVGISTIFVYILLYNYGMPQDYDTIHQIAENEHLMKLLDQTSQTIPDVSISWHRVRLKIQDLKIFFATQIREMKARLRQYGPEPQKTTDEKLEQLSAQCSVLNWYLLVKSVVITAFFVYMMIPFIYHAPIKYYHYYEEMRLGFIGLFVGLCILLLIHSRDLELMLKRIDWEALIVVGSLTMMSNVFCFLTKNMYDFLWKLYGTSMVGTPKRKVHMVLLQIIMFGSMAGLINSEVVFLGFLDTAFQYAIFQGLDSLDVIFAGFNLSTGFWGNASPLGSYLNIFGTGAAAQQGYRQETSFFRFMLYGVPTACFNNLVLYFYMLFRKLL